MECAIHGKQMDVGDSLRAHVTEKLSDINSKFFNRAFAVNVTFAPEGHSFTKCHISLKVGKDILVTASSEAADPYGAFDDTAMKIARQLRRYKTRLRDHHDRSEPTPEKEMMKARDYVVAVSSSGGSDKEIDEAEAAVSGQDPLIVAETPMQIYKMSVADAVMRLDLGDQAAILFRNPKNNSLNMVYRRSDGNIGWVEPIEADQKSVAAE
jgi:ribosomal subunit interface protein